MLLSFSIPEQRPMIEAGLRQVAGEDVGGERVKRQTIRRIRTNRSPWLQLHPGRPLHLWWRSRTKERQFLGGVDCAAAQFLRIGPTHGEPVMLCANRGELWKPLTTDEKRTLAVADGFDSVEQMIGFLKPPPHSNWDGLVIGW